MKKLYLILSLLALLSLNISAKSNKKTPQVPTITVSPAVWTIGQPLEFVGSGYQAGDVITIELQGPVSEFIYFTVGSDGAFDIHYQTASFINVSGYYEVTTYQGSSLSAAEASNSCASTGFEVE